MICRNCLLNCILLTVLQQTSVNNTKLPDSQQDSQQSTHTFTQACKYSSSKQDTSQKSLFSKDYKRVAHTPTQSSSQLGNKKVLSTQCWMNAVVQPVETFGKRGVHLKCRPFVSENFHLISAFHLYLIGWTENFSYAKNIPGLYKWGTTVQTCKWGMINWAVQCMLEVNHTASWPALNRSSSEVVGDENSMHLIWIY